MKMLFTTIGLSLVGKTVPEISDTTSRLTDNILMHLLATVNKSNHLISTHAVYVRDSESLLSKKG